MLGYTFGQSYLRAAQHVAPARLDRDAPKYFLYAHTMELALKAYPRATGTSVAGLKRIGHGPTGLLAKARAGGLQDERHEINAAVIGLLDQYGPRHEFGYIYTGSKTFPS